MDVRTIRVALASVAVSGGFNAWDFLPDDPQNLPAAIINGLDEIKRLNATVTQVKIPITLLVSTADQRDATARLDLAVSVNVEGSLIDLLDDVADPPWRSIRFDSAGAYTRVQMPGGAIALGVDVVFELTA